MSLFHMVFRVKKKQYVRSERVTGCLQKAAPMAGWVLAIMAVAPLYGPGTPHIPRARGAGAPHARPALHRA